MSELKIRDFYGQCLRVHNETSSGNIYLVGKTCADLNKARLTSEENMEITTEIVLDAKRARLLIATLEHMVRDGDE